MRFVLFALLMVVASGPAASSQDASRMTTQRIEFEPGDSSTSVYGEIADGRSHRYLVRVRRGQRLSVNVHSFDEESPTDVWAAFQVYAPDRPIEPRYAAPSMHDGERFDVNHWEGRLSQSGDYQIVVYPEKAGASTWYDLYVSVE